MAIVRSHSTSYADESRAEVSKSRTHDDGLSAFMSVRPRLFGIAYRMLGNAAEAEDIVQDVWVRRDLLMARMPAHIRLYERAHGDDAQPRGTR
jgi:DNA-directed RNA polymerase specialized sigma24 family protein